MVFHTIRQRSLLILSKSYSQLEINMDLFECKLNYSFHLIMLCCCVEFYIDTDVDDDDDNDDENKLRDS